MAGGDDDSQTTDPAMNFANPVYDGMRGHLGDSIHKEYIPATDQSWYADTGKRIHDAIAAVAGHSYTVEASAGLYPTSGTTDDYAYARHSATAGARKVWAFAIETGTEFQPAFPGANQVMAEAMAAAMELCVAALCVVEDTSASRTYADRLGELRTFRDEVLMSSAAGRRYIAALDGNTLEILTALARDPKLRPRSSSCSSSRRPSCWMVERSTTTWSRLPAPCSRAWARGQVGN